MNLKKSMVAAAVAGALALGAAGQAAAYVYAGSRLLIDDLTVNIAPTQGGFVEPVVLGYTFTTRADAELGNDPVISTNSCGTIAGPPCPNTAPVLQSLANADGNTQDRALNQPTTFSFFGPGATDTYANSASEIGESELATGNPTSASQIAEVELQGTGEGSASTRVSSTTQLSFVFTIAEGTTASFVLDFLADPNLFVAVDTDDLIAADAQASTSFAFSMQSGNGTVISWNPGGFVTDDSDIDFASCVGATCVENLDPRNLQRELSLPPGNPSSLGFSDDRSASADSGLERFRVTLTGLQGGTYNVGLTGTTFSRAEQVVAAIPEPTSLALLGLGLAGLGFATRRGNRADRG